MINLDTKRKPEDEDSGDEGSGDEDSEDEHKPPGKLLASKRPLITQVISTLKTDFPEVADATIETAVTMATKNAENIEAETAKNIIENYGQSICKNIILLELREIFGEVTPEIIDKTMEILKINKIFNNQITKGNYKNIQATAMTIIQLQQYFLERPPGTFQKSVDKFVNETMSSAISMSSNVLNVDKMMRDSRQILDLALIIVGMRINYNDFRGGSLVMDAYSIVLKVPIPKGAFLSESCFTTIASCFIDITMNPERNLEIPRQVIPEIKPVIIKSAEDIFLEKFNAIKYSHGSSESFRDSGDEMSQEILPSLIELELPYDDLHETVVARLHGESVISHASDAVFIEAEKRDDTSKPQTVTKVAEVSIDLPKPRDIKLYKSEADLDALLDSLTEEFTRGPSMEPVEGEEGATKQEIIQEIGQMRANNKSAIDDLSELVKQQTKLFSKINESYLHESSLDEPSSATETAMETSSIETSQKDELISRGEESYNSQITEEVEKLQREVKTQGEGENKKKKDKIKFIENDIKIAEIQHAVLASQSSSQSLVQRNIEINMNTFFGDDDFSPEDVFPSPEKRRAGDGSSGSADDGSDNEDEDSSGGVAIPNSPSDTFLVDQGGDGVCFILATLYVICKWLFILFAILTGSREYVKPTSFTEDEVKLLNANMTVNGNIDPRQLNVLLSLLRDDSYVYNISVVYVFLFTISINLINNNGEDPNKGGFSVSSMLLITHFLYTIIAEEPEITNNDDENFDHFTKFYSTYITEDNSKKLKYPHNYNAYKRLVLMMRRIKYGPASVQVAGLPVPGCPVFRIGGDDTKSPIGKLNEFTISKAVAHNKQIGLLTSIFTLSINHNLLGALLDCLITMEKMRLNKKKLQAKHEQIIAALEKILATKKHYQVLVGNLTATNKPDIIIAADAAVAQAEKDIADEIAEQKKEIAELNARLKVKKVPLIDELKKVKLSNEAENHVITLIARVVGEKDGQDVCVFRLKNTWVGKHISPWFKSDFLWKYMGVSNVFNDFRVSVVSCSFLFTPGNEISTTVNARFPLDAGDVALCKELYVAVAAATREKPDPNKLDPSKLDLSKPSVFATVIGKFVGQYDPFKIVKSQECKELINEIIRRVIGTNEMVMFITMLHTFGKPLGYQIYGTSFTYTYWSYLLRSEQLAYLSSRVMTMYTLLHFFTYGNSHNVTLITPESIEPCKKFALICIKSVIDGESMIIEKNSTQLWLLLLYVIQLFQPTFDQYANARATFPGSTYSVTGYASGKLCVFPKRGPIFKRIEGALSDINQRHKDATKTVDNTLDDLITDVENASILPGSRNDQLSDLKQMWENMKETLVNPIPLDNFEESLRILERVIGKFDHREIRKPPLSPDSASSSMVDGSSSSVSLPYQQLTRSAYASSYSSGDAPIGKNLSSFSLELSPENEINLHLRIMYTDLYPDFFKLDFTPEEEKDIATEYASLPNHDEARLARYYEIKKQQSSRYAGGSRRKVFQQCTKKQKNNNNKNNKKCKKTKMNNKNKNNNKKRSRKPSKKRHLLKTNTNTKRKR